MATLDGNLWEANFVKVVVLDVTDDYRVMQPPLPNDCYPVVAQLWIPKHKLVRRLPELELVEGYLYDWHQSPLQESGDWYVGVVHSDLLSDPTIAPLA